MTPPRVVAVIPAAGQSRRMGRPKQLLEVDGQPMLIGVIETLAAGGVSETIVVTSHQIAQSLTLGDMVGVQVIFNENPKTDMIDSVRLGLRAVFEDPSALRAEKKAPAGILICPADHPGLSAADIRACLDAFACAPDRIIIAARNGRRGHPIAFPIALAEFVQSAACDSGLNALPRAMPERVTEVSCCSLGVTRDVDTPDDYAASS